jgi:DNA-binding NtrC family response regulator
VGANERTVLVVDDEASIRLLCRINLELEGYRLLEAAGLDEARRILEAEPVDVVLVDIHLGHEDGRMLVGDVARDNGVRTRVALLTGSVDLGVDERGGADAVIEKPFRLDQLIDTVGRLASELDSTAP